MIFLFNISKPLRKTKKYFIIQFIGQQYYWTGITIDQSAYVSQTIGQTSDTIWIDGQEWQEYPLSPWKIAAWRYQIHFPQGVTYFVRIVSGLIWIMSLHLLFGCQIVLWPNRGNRYGGP